MNRCARAAKAAAAVLHAALPFQKNLWEPDEDLKSIFAMSANDARESADEAMAALRQIDKIMTILEDESDKGYRQAIRALPDDWLPVWKEACV